MKDYPQNTKEWSKEAYQALIPAWDQLKQNNPFPSEKQKENLIEIATEMACANRDINDSKFKQHAMIMSKKCLWVITIAAISKRKSISHCVLSSLISMRICP